MYVLPSKLARCGVREWSVIHSGPPVVSARRRSVLAGGCRGCEAGLPVWVVEEVDEDEVPPPGETLKTFLEPFTCGIHRDSDPRHQAAQPSRDPAIGPVSGRAFVGRCRR